jgi:subtilisin family serine protease
MNFAARRLTTSRWWRRKRRGGLLVGASCAIAGLVLPLTASGEPGRDAEFAREPTHPYVVVLKEAKVANPARVAERHEENRDADLAQIYDTAIEGYAAELTHADKKAIEQDPNVAYVERDLPVELLSQTIPTGISRVGMTSNPSLNPISGEDIQVDADVAVIDTPIDFRHPDLNVVASVDCNDNDKPPYVCKNSNLITGFHGTHVAGIIGAKDNGFGVVGIAPGVRLWSASIGADEGVMSGVIAGLDWAVGTGKIEVINMSLACGDSAGQPWCQSASSGLKTAIANAVDAGIVVIAAAGNEHQDVAMVPRIPASFPDPITVSALADFDGVPGALAPVPSAKACNSVGATKPEEKDDSLAEFSNWGAGVDIIAPGSCILSTMPLGTAPGGGDYLKLSGTSMASPHVAGAAAVLAAIRNPSNRSDVMAIRQDLLNEGSFNWTDDSGWGSYPPDTVQEPLLDIHDPSVFRVPHPGSVGNVGVVSHTHGSIDLFARNGNNEIWHKVYHSGPQWGSWYTEPLPNGKQIYGAPAVGSRNPLSRDLFVRDQDGYLYFRNFYSGQGWSDWFWIPGPHDGKILNSPAVTDRPDRQNGLDVVVRSDNNRIYFKEYTDPTGWGSWYGMGEPPPGTASSPATAFHGFHGSLHLMVRGKDGAIWDRWWAEGLGWTEWATLGSPPGGAVSAPALTPTESGNDLYVFAVGADGAMWVRKGTNGWGPWESLGGQWVSDPAATSKESHGVSVFAAGLDNKIQERRFLYGGWTNWMRIDDNDCPPPECTWTPSQASAVFKSSPDPTDLISIDSSGTANVFTGYDEGFLLSDRVKSQQGQLDSALLDGKGHYVVDAADVNDDLHPDLVTVKDDGKVLVHLGKGDRTFDAALDTGVSLPLTLNGKGQNEPIAVADVTGDGFDDLVAFDASAAAFAVYKGQLNGKFATTAVQSTENPGTSALHDGVGQYYVDVADVTGDGRADLVTLNTNGYVYVYRGNADGKLGSFTFTTQIDPIMNDGSGQEPVGVADVTGDGLADLVTLDGSTLKLWAGKDDATFAAASTAYAGSIDSSLMDGVGEGLVGLLDYDGDGRSDLVSVKAQGGLRTYKANSESKFSAPVDHGALGSIRHLEKGFEFPLEKGWARRRGCTEGGCTWLGVSERMAPAALAAESAVRLYTRSEGGLLYQRSSAGAGWSKPTQIGAQTATSAPAAVLHAGATNVYARGADGMLQQKWCCSGSDGWSSWFSLGGPGGQPITSGPAAVGHAGTVEVYARGSDGMLHRRSCCSGEGWSGWSQVSGPLGGSITAAPAAASHAGAVELIVRGTDGLLYQKKAAEGSWTQISGPGGQPVTSAAAVTSHAGALNVYVRGNDGLLYQKARTSEGWTGWFSLGAPGGEPIATKPTAVAPSDGTVRVYVRGGDGKLHQRWCCSGPEGWSSWQTVGSADQPAVDSDVTGDGRADLVSLRADGVAYAHPANGEAKFGSGVASFSGDPLDPAQYDGEGDYVVDVADVAGFIGERRADLVTLDEEGNVHVYAGQANGGFAEDGVTSELGLDPGLLGAGGDEPIAAADVTGDGHADLIVHDAALSRVLIHIGQPDGSFDSSAVVARKDIASALHTGNGHHFVDAADVTGDDRADLVSMHQGSLMVFAGQGDATFAAPVTSHSGAIDPATDDGAGYEPIGLGDVTGDGLADLALVKAGTVYLYPGSAAGSFGAPATSFGGGAPSTTFGSAGVEYLGLLDANGDGNADLVGVINVYQMARVVLGQASGVFVTAVNSAGAFPSTQHGANQTSSGNQFAVEKPAWRRSGCQAAGCGWTGTDTVGMFRPGDKAWYLRNTNSSGATDVSFGFSFEHPAEVPLTGDWNGDGIDTIGIYRPGTGQFLLRNSSSAGPADLSFTYTQSNPAQIPVAGDWNGDGIDTIGLYVPVVGAWSEGEGVFHLRNSNSAGAPDHSFAYNFANANEIPLTGDWDGDGDDTIGLYQPVVGEWSEGEGMFHLRNANSSGETHHSFAYNWANPQEIPATGDWDGDGDDTIGLYQPQNGYWHLRNFNSSGAAQHSFTYSWGAAWDVPVTGDWNGA